MTFTSVGLLLQQKHAFQKNAMHESHAIACIACNASKMLADNLTQAYDARDASKQLAMLRCLCDGWVA